MRIVVAGDSYSVQWDFRMSIPIQEKWAQPYYSWASELAKLFTVENVAHPGYTLQEIEQSLENKSYDLAIVNLSPMDRIPRNVSSSRKLTRLNVKSARQIISMPNTYCWSPFPEWEKINEVDTIHYPDDDELWWIEDPKRFSLVTGNHFTRAGNERLLKHMIKVIEVKNSRALRATL